MDRDRNPAEAPGRPQNPADFTALFRFDEIKRTRRVRLRPGLDVGPGDWIQDTAADALFVVVEIEPNGTTEDGRAATMRLIQGPAHPTGWSDFEDLPSERPSPTTTPGPEQLRGDDQVEQLQAVEDLRADVDRADGTKQLQAVEDLRADVDRADGTEQLQAAKQSRGAGRGGRARKPR